NGVEVPARIRCSKGRSRGEAFRGFCCAALACEGTRAVDDDVDVRDFLGLRPTHNPHRWVLPGVPGISTGARFLVGGCGLAACVAALETTTGRPLVYATAQYLAYAKTSSILDIDVFVEVAGHHVTQARAVGHVNDREILTVNAALGRREFAV